ncbi:MAG TPA: hypothetical protein VH592_09350 [Gemmataceae bacterium]
MGAEAREAGLYAFSNAAEKRLHAAIHAPESVTFKFNRSSLEARHSLSQSGKPLALLNEMDGITAPLIRLGPLLQRPIVEPATGPHPRLQGVLLSRRERHFHLNRFEHETKIS